MDHIFGDTQHDITFGAPSHEAKPAREGDQQKQKFTRSTGQKRPEPRPTSSLIQASPRKKEESVRAPDNAVPTIAESDALSRLVTSMKTSFLPKEEDTSTMRLVAFSPSNQKDPLMLITRDDETLLFGSGFSEILRAGKTYQTFPDMRLIFSEKEHISAWVLTDETMSLRPFLSILPSLGFPPIYAPRGVIAKFREEIKDTSFLEKCRFFELFAGGVTERRIGAFELSLGSCGELSCLSIRTNSSQFGLEHVRLLGGGGSPLAGEQILHAREGNFVLGNEEVAPGEILIFRGKNIAKHTLKYTFDTFYIDENSVGVVAGYTLPDREQLAENGILTFTLEEDMRARTIAGHIFIDSRGFVHAYEMMAVHKEILKGIRATYEKLILDNQRIERGELVQSLRREITKYCYVLTGRTPVVMPIVIER